MLQKFVLNGDVPCDNLRATTPQAQDFRAILFDDVLAALPYWPERFGHLLSPSAIDSVSMGQYCTDTAT
jgi:hypothetical protein